jgi:hypothetical protein
MGSQLKMAGPAYFGLVSHAEWLEKPSFTGTTPGTVSATREENRGLIVFTVDNIQSAIYALMDA